MTEDGVEDAGIRHAFDQPRLPLRTLSVRRSGISDHHLSHRSGCIACGDPGAAGDGSAIVKSSSVRMPGSTGSAITRKIGRSFGHVSGTSRALGFPPETGVTEHHDRRIPAWRVRYGPVRSRWERWDAASYVAARQIHASLSTPNYLLESFRTSMARRTVARSSDTFARTSRSRAPGTGQRRSSCFTTHSRGRAITGVGT